MQKQTIELTIGADSICFDLSRDDYNKYINALTPKSKISATHNFLVSTVRPEDKAKLLSTFENHPGSEMQVLEAVLNEYTPDLAITAKKLSP